MSRKKISYISNLCYTKFGVEDTDTCAREWLEKCNKYARWHQFQLEKCPTTGRLHYQGYMELTRQQKFDTMGSFLGCTIREAGGTWEENLTYCTKEETRVLGPWDNGGIPKGRGRFAKPKSNTRNEIARAVLSAPTVDEAISMAIEQLPHDYLMNGQKMRENIQHTHLPPPKAPHPLWHYKHEPIIDFSRTILFWGASDTGKTQFAAAHFKRPCIVSSPERLKTQFRKGYHDGVVLNEVNWLHWPTDTVKRALEVEEEAELYCRHVNAFLPPGFPRILTSQHENPFYSPDGYFDKSGFKEHNPECIKAIERRVFRYEFTESIVRTSEEKEEYLRLQIQEEVHDNSQPSLEEFLTKELQ